MRLVKDGFLLGGDRLFNKLCLYVAEKALERHADRDSRMTVEYFQIIRELEEDDPTPLRKRELQGFLHEYRPVSIVPKDFTVEDWDDESQSGTLEILFEDRFHHEEVWVRARLSSRDGVDEILEVRYS